MAFAERCFSDENPDEALDAAKDRIAELEAEIALLKTRPTWEALTAIPYKRVFFWDGAAYSVRVEPEGYLELDDDEESPVGWEDEQPRKQDSGVG